jgi:hypothetical protein
MPPAWQLVFGVTPKRCDGNWQADKQWEPRWSEDQRVAGVCRLAKGDRTNAELG